MSVFKHIESLIQHPIRQPELYETAFRHTSYVNEQRRHKLASNERLEFLGDAVLELVVSRYLFMHFPHKPEGYLSRIRAQLVREDTLAFLATQNKLDHYLKLGYGEESNGGRQRLSLLADLFEAFLGAVYLDLGLEVVEDFLIQAMLNDHSALLQKANQDYKTQFQEKIQQRGSVSIKYQLLEQHGPSHDQVFEMGLYVDDRFISKGRGKTKKAAEMEAAKAGLNFVDEKGNLNVSK